MPALIGKDSFALKLRAKKAQAAAFSRRRVWVGYAAEYAIFVHENLTAHHPVGQAKFLEEPARTFQPQMRAVIQQVLAAGGTADEALYAAGLALQAESQRLCPIDTGFLRNSAYTLVEIL